MAVILLFGQKSYLFQFNSKTMNKAILVGNITMDPKITATEQGTVIASTSMATNEYYKDKHGEKQQTTEFHNLVAFGKT